ncbi:MAG: exosortase/archaeosortase family protein [Terriglobales bacterium]
MTIRNQMWGFAFLCALSLLFWWHALAMTMDLALRNEASTHILLILPLSVSLIYLDRSRWRRSDRDAGLALSRGGIGVGLAALAGAALILCLARWGQPQFNISPGGQLSLSMFALVIWWIGSVILSFGVGIFRSFLFPLCFLFWMVPLPPFALERIVLFLQQQSAFAARMLFLAAGVPVIQNGLILSIPSLDIEVASECSSIRSSLMLIVIAMVLAQLFLRSRWRKAVVVAAAIPLAVAKNGLRIFAIAELGTRVDPGFLTGNFHHHGGIVFLGIGVVAVGALVWALRRSELRRARASGTSAESRN